MQKKITSHLFWGLSIEEVTSILETDIEKGISEQEVNTRKKEFGENKFGGIKKFSRSKTLSKQFKSPFIFILLIAGIATLFLHEWVDATIIFLAIGINTALGFYQENKAETTLSKLQSYIQERTRVIRDGIEREVDAASIVPGDIIHLVSGSRVPADARLISINGLRVDEAILTGESLAVEKEIKIMSGAASIPDRKNMVFGGTLVAEGNGIAIVTSTSDNTEIGKIADLVFSTEQELTPLQKAVAKLSWVIAIVVTFLVAGIFALGLYRGESVFEMFLMSVAVAVGAIPEALPIGLTAVLAVGVEQLAKKKGVMRNLSAAETLGSTSVIMTDKTGTLTEGNMKLVDILSKDDLLSGLSHTDGNSSLERFSQKQKGILSLATINTNVLIENKTDKPEDWRMSGNTLEINIIRSAALHGIDVIDGEHMGKFQNTLPFNSKNKFSVSKGELNTGIKEIEIKKGSAKIILGAPDILLQKAKMDKDSFVLLQKRIEELSKEGKRLLALAVKYDDLNSNDASDIKDLTFIGILAFYDPIRKTAPQAIEKMERFGVRVVMATGDLKGTAMAVARDLGWNIDAGSILSGDEIQQMDDDDLKEALEKVRIFARVTPEDKLRIGKLFQQRGEVVAMTGDGVNDAPSLKAVDIGIAVGSGSDVAKGVADLVLLDDNFDVIVSAIEEGKRMLRNIRKTFVYLMSNSLDEVIIIGGSLLAGLALPLTAIQIIWVNFFTGSLPAIAFAFDKDFDVNIKESKTEKVVLNKEVKFLTIGIGILTSFLLFFMYWFLMSTSLSEDVVRTFLFACFSSYILFVAFSLRSLKKPLFSYNVFSNRFLNVGVFIGILLLASTIYIPFLQDIFNTVALSLLWIALIVIWVIINIALVEFAKWLFYRQKKV